MRAFRADGTVISLSDVAPQGIDAEGFAYGKFVITHAPGRIAQVPPPDASTTEIITPVIEAAYDFKDNAVSEIDAKGIHCN